MTDFEYYRNLLKRPTQCPPHTHKYTQRQVRLVKNALWRLVRLKTSNEVIEENLQAMLDRDPALYDAVIEEYDNYRVFQDEMRMEAWDAYCR